jgi:hypothetical protein
VNGELRTCSEMVSWARSDLNRSPRKRCWNASLDSPIHMMPALTHCLTSTAGASDREIRLSGEGDGG